MTLTDLERKLLLLAMDPAAHHGEIENCALRLLVMLRSRYPDGHSLIKDLESAPQHIPDPVMFFRMPFGKHKGKPLMEIPPDYLSWLVREANLWPETREMIMKWMSNHT